MGAFQDFGEFAQGILEREKHEKAQMASDALALFEVFRTLRAPELPLPEI
jgi:hypothetical protein